MATEPRGNAVAVTGATGFVGRAVVRALRERGIPVRAHSRERDRAEGLFGTDPGVHIVTGELPSDETAGTLVRGCTACVHLVGIIREHGRSTFERVHVGATRSMLDACRRGGVRRFVHMSALGADPEGPAPYQRTKHEAETLVRRSGLAWTIFRPSLIHGPEGEFMLMAQRWAGGAAQPWLFIPYFTRPVMDETVPLGAIRFEPARVQPVSVDDVAECFARAITTDRTIGEVYHVVGSESLTWREMMTFLRDTLPGADAGLPVLGVPAPVAVASARAARALGLSALLPFDEGQAHMAARDSTAELSKVALHLGVRPRAFRPSVRAYAPTMPAA